MLRIEGEAHVVKRHLLRINYVIMFEVMTNHQNSVARYYAPSRGITYQNEQCDQTLKLKVAQFSPKFPKNGQFSYFTIKRGF